MTKEEVYIKQQKSENSSSTSSTKIMSLDHHLIFADNLFLRCKCVKDEYLPMEILDFQDILDRLRNLFLSKLEKTGNMMSNIKKESSIKEKLFLFHDSDIEEGEKISLKDQKLSAHFAKTHMKQTDSVVLQVSPLMRHRRMNNNGKQDVNSSQYRLHGNRKRKNVIDCLNESSSDFVHVVTYKDLASAEDFLRDLRDSTDIETIAVDIDVSRDLSISISYQRLMDFKQDFMMVDLKQTNFMLFLKPF